MLVSDGQHFSLRKRNRIKPKSVKLVFSDEERED